MTSTPRNTAPAPTRPPWFYHGMALATVCIWSFSFLFIIWVQDHVDPMGVAVGRKIIFAPLAVMLLLWRRPALRALSRVDWVVLITLGIVAGPLYHVTFAWAAGRNALGEERISTALLGLILATVPIHTAWLAAIFLKESLTKRRLVALSLGMVGVTVVIIGNTFARGGDSASIFSLSRLEGPIGAVASAIVGGGIVVVTRRARTVMGPFDVVAVSGLLIVLFSVCFSPWANLGQMTNLPPISAYGMLFLGIFGSGVAFLTWATALSGLQAGTVATYLFVSCVLAAIWGWLFRDQPISLAFIPGSALVFGGLLMMARSPAPIAQPVPEPVESD